MDRVKGRVRSFVHSHNCNSFTKFTGNVNQDQFRSFWRPRKFQSWCPPLKIIDTYYVLTDAGSGAPNLLHPMRLPSAPIDQGQPWYHILVAVAGFSSTNAVVHWNSKWLTSLIFMMLRSSDDDVVVAYWYAQNIQRKWWLDPLSRTTEINWIFISTTELEMDEKKF